MEGERGKDGGECMGGGERDGRGRDWGTEKRKEGRKVVTDCFMLLAASTF